MKLEEENVTRQVINMNRLKSFIKTCGQPFHYWFSSNHTSIYEQNSKEADIELASIRVPDYLPDNDSVRGDIADYYA